MYSEIRPRNFPWRATAIVCLLAIPTALVASDEAPARDPAAARADLEAAYAHQLADLATWCDGQHLSSQAHLLRAWLPRREPDKLYFFSLPESFSPPMQESSNASTSGWWQRFVKLREAQANALFALAEKALDAHQPTLAYELVRETVRENPDHAKGRAILGYEKCQDRWMSAYAARRVTAGQIWSAKYGWIAAADLPRYDRGERSAHGNWITAEEDTRWHANIKSGWRVETEHYVVTTNDSLESGVHLAARLERLYEFWQQLFLTYYTTEAELKKRFDGASPPRESRPHQVVYFHDRDQYNAALRPSEPRIGMTLGYYRFENRTAYFFAGPDQDPATQYHEETHQLFQEVRPSVRDLGRKNNFWIVEGIACYMESLAGLPNPEDPLYCTVGGFEEGRLPLARLRLLKEHTYTPLGELVAMSRDTMQHDAHLPILYSQSAGLAMLLMQSAGGRYRQPLMDYLQAVYSNHATDQTLAKLTGASYEQLDRQYLDYLKSAGPVDVEIKAK